METNIQLGMQQDNISALVELENSLNVYENPYLTKFQMERILNWRKDLPTEGQWENIDHFDTGSRDEMCSCLLHKNKSNCICLPNKLHPVEMKKKPVGGKRNTKRRYCSVESHEEIRMPKQSNCFELLNLENKSETLGNQKKKCKFDSADERKLSDVIKKMKSTVLSSENNGEARDNFAHISNHMTSLEFYEETLIKKKKRDDYLQELKIKTKKNQNKCSKLKGSIERKIKINHQNHKIEEIWMQGEIKEEILSKKAKVLESNKKINIKEKPTETSRKIEPYKKNNSNSLMRNKNSCKTIYLNKVSFFIPNDKHFEQNQEGTSERREQSEIKTVPRKEQCLLKNIRSPK